MDRVKNLKILTLTLLGIFVLFFLPFWKSLSVSAIFAFFIYPYLCKRSEKKKTVNGKIVVGAVTLTTLLILAPLLVGVYTISSQVVEYSKADGKEMKSTNVKDILSSQLRGIVKVLSIPENKSTKSMIESSSTIAADNITKYATEVVVSIPDIIMELIIFTLGLYIFLYYGAMIKNEIVMWNILSKKDLEELIDVVQVGSKQCILSLLIVGSMQASIIVIGAAIAGYSKLLMIFLITFVFSFIPIIGAAPVGFFLGFLTLVDGDVGMGVFLFVVASFTGIIDNIARPLLIKRGIDMDGAVALINIIGSLVILGLPGLFIGPVVGTTATYYFHRAEKKKQAELKRKAAVNG